VHELRAVQCIEYHFIDEVIPRGDVLSVPHHLFDQGTHQLFEFVIPAH